MEGARALGLESSVAIRTIDQRSQSEQRPPAGRSPRLTIIYLYTFQVGLLPRSMAAKRCTSSREGKVLLSCWISEELRMELDRVWASKGLRPHGRTQKGMEEMIALYLASHPEA